MILNAIVIINEVLFFKLSKMVNYWLVSKFEFENFQFCLQNRQVSIVSYRLGTSVHIIRGAFRRWWTVLVKYILYSHIITCCFRTIMLHCRSVVSLKRRRRSKNVVQCASSVNVWFSQNGLAISVNNFNFSNVATSFAQTNKRVFHWGTNQDK